MWRLINFFLPFPDVLEKFGFNLPSKCVLCCKESESMFHVFYSCEFSHQLWSCCWDRLHIPERMPQHLVSALHILWENGGGGSGNKTLLSIFPSILLWEIWKKRNEGIYNNKATTLAATLRSLDNTLHDIITSGGLRATTQQDQLLVRQNFGHILPIKSKPLPQVLIWKYPPAGYFKLNTDGSYCRGMDGSGGSYVLRDERGDLVEAASFRMQATTAFGAELKALFVGLSKCIALGFHKVKIESDCKTLVLYLKDGKNYPWRWRKEMKDTGELLRSKDFELDHIFRETNCVADILAKLGFSVLDCNVFVSLDDLPNRARGALLLDKQQFPYVRL